MQIVMAFWVLYKGFFDAVPGQKGLLGIGVLLLCLGYFQNDAAAANILVMASAAFTVGFTLIFAGPHFRRLACLKRNRLLPHFKWVLISSYLAVLGTLSLILFVSLFLVDKDIFPSLKHTPKIVIVASVLSLMLITSLFGFLNRNYRLAFLLLVIACVANRALLSQQSVTHMLLVLMTIATIGLLYFVYNTSMGTTDQFYSKKAMSLAKYTPGLNGNFEQAGVTAVGSVLLGFSDGYLSRFARAFFTASVIPIFLFFVALGFRQHSPEQLLSDLKLIFFALITATALHIHLIFTAKKNKRFIWLRVGGDRKYISLMVKQLLAKERWMAALCFALWSFPVVGFYPQVAFWVFGLGLLLWFTLLVVEEFVLFANTSLSQGTEFYVLLALFGVLVGIVAISSVAQQANVLWWGVGALALTVSGLKIKRMLVQ